jgi:hypothetical protein
MATRDKCTSKRCPANAIFKLSLPGHADRFACRMHLSAQTEEIVGTSGNATTVEVKTWQGGW